MKNLFLVLATLTLFQACDFSPEALMGDKPRDDSSVGFYPISPIYPVQSLEKCESTFGEEVYSLKADHHDIPSPLKVVEGVELYQRGDILGVSLLPINPHEFPKKHLDISYLDYREIHTGDVVRFKCGRTQPQTNEATCSPNCRISHTNADTPNAPCESFVNSDVSFSMNLEGRGALAPYAMHLNNPYTKNDDSYGFKEGQSGSDLQKYDYCSTLRKIDGVVFPSLDWLIEGKLPDNNTDAPGTVYSGSVTTEYGMSPAQNRAYTQTFGMKGVKGSVGVNQSASTSENAPVDDIAVPIAPIGTSALTFTPSYWDFGEVSPGQTSTKTFVVTNSTDSSVYISSITSSDSHFFTTSHSCPVGSTPLGAGMTCTLVVRFDPSQR